eukprot:1698042-Alexandrium_andersonii.AAC.1
MGSCFLAKDTSETSLTVFVLKDRDPRAFLAHPVLCKGSYARGHGGVQHPQAGAPPQGPAQDGQRAGPGGPPRRS